MKTQGKLGSRPAIIATVLTISLSIFFIPTIAADYGHNAAWMVILLAGVLAIVLSLILNRLMRLFPDKTIVEVSYIVLGKYLGFLAGLLIFAFFLFDSALSLRLIGDRITTIYLPSTPLSVAMVYLLIGGVFCAYLGIEPIVRGVAISWGFLLVAALLPIILSFPFWKVQNLFPLFGSGWKPIAIGGLSMLGLFSEVILLAVIYPSISTKQPENLWTPSIVWALVLMLITTIGVELVFPYPVLNETLFPLAQVSRLVYLTQYIQRIDSFISFIWMGAMTYKFALVYTVTVFTLTQLFRLPYYKPFIFGLGIIVFTLGMLPHDIIEVTYLISEWFWRIGWVIAFALPGIMLLVFYFRRRVLNLDKA
ncbi:MAG: endospore germination permease [Firmicutes bacterium]|nr:endospore germination permease [Bacillota bacterium]